MSKMAEMAQTIEELRTAAASINAAADWLYQQFSGDDDKAQSTEARALIPKYGAAKLAEIDPANYEALLQDAEVIGNGS